MQLLILVTPNFNLAATMAFIDPFRAANYLEGKPIFSWRFVSLEGGSCLSSNGVAIETDRLPEPTEKPDLVVVSSSWTPERHFQPKLITFLRRMSSNGALLAGLDTGAFLMARAGLLSGKRATVHYEHIDAMMEMFPDVDVREELLVLDGNCLSCCGGCASTDFALHLLRRLERDSLASAVARYIFHQSLRPEDSQQNPGRVEPLGNTVPTVVREAIAAMERHLETPLAIPDVSEEVGISQRQLDRLFKRFVGKSPSVYYRDIRLDRARGLVTQTDLPLASVAAACGFAGQAQFCRAYRELFGLSPRTDRVEGRIPFEYRAWPMHRRDRTDPS